MADWKKAVSANASTVTIQNISNYVSSNAREASPIDSFYEGRNELICAANPGFSASNPSVLPLLLVGLISLTENYFRAILSRVINQCPKAREKSAHKTLNLATVWHGYGDLERGIFENISFSDAKTIKKNLDDLIDLKLSGNNQIIAPLEEFDKLCELRHAIVHSAGFLAGKNAIRLQLPSSRTSVKAVVGYSQLQEAADICTALVCAVNLELFVLISRRWLHEWPSSPAYMNSNHNQLFKKIWETFYSEFDASHGSIACSLTQTKARNLIIRTNAA